MIRRILLFVAVTVTCLPALTAEGAKIGAEASNLTFKDIRCLNRSLSDLGEAKGYALVFMNTSCPIAQRYLPRLEELHKKYAAQGIQFVAVYNSQDETPKDIAAHGLDAGLTFPLGVGRRAKVHARRLGVERVPQAVLLDGSQEGRLLGPHRRSIPHWRRAAASRPPRSGRSDRRTAGRQADLGRRNHGRRLQGHRLAGAQVRPSPSPSTSTSKRSCRSAARTATTKEPRRRSVW